MIHLLILVFSVSIQKSSQQRFDSSVLVGPSDDCESCKFEASGSYNLTLTSGVVRLKINLQLLN